MDNKKQLFNTFIENELKITDYSLKFYNVGKNNITASVEFDNKEFIIQYLNNILDTQVELIDKVLEICNKEGFISANKFYEKRFFKYNGGYFQIMEKLDGENKTYTELTKDELKDVIQYVAKFHNMIEKYDFIEFENSTENIKNPFHFLNLSYNSLKKYGNYEDKFNELLELAGKVKVTSGLRRGLIHGDFILKNILLKNNKVSGIVDYEMLKYGDFMLDLVDHFRNYMKTPEFKKTDYFDLLKAYEEIRPLTDIEKSNLGNYQKLLSLSTGFEYFLALFEGSGFSNNTTDMGNSFEKVDRCIKEFKKAESFFE